jgi:GNAT superfamily N-acetyltransferase
MTWSMTADLDEFLAAAAPFLHTDAAANTVPLSIADSLRSRGPHAFGDADPLFGWWCSPGGTVTGALVQTPPHPALLTDTPDEAVKALAETLAAGNRPLSGVNALQRTADLFAAEWHRHTGRTAEVHRRMRLHRLGELTPPDPIAPGAPRVGGPADRELLVDWHRAFADEIGEPSVNVDEFVDDRISHNGLTLWEVDSAPVSMAGVTRPVAGVVRVASVYTPVELRGRGYASAVTAAVSQAVRDAGAAEVVLFTDLANPTSNAIYRRLGYRPVGDRVVLSFTG